MMISDFWRILHAIKSKSADNSAFTFTDMFLMLIYLFDTLFAASIITLATFSGCDINTT